MAREELKTATNDELIYALNYCGYDSYYRDYRDDVVAEIKKRMQKSCEDAVSKKDVFDEYGNYKYPSDVELTEPNTATSMPCEDIISRKIITAFLSRLISDDAERKKALQYVNELPSVTPQPKTGHWIIIDDCEKFIAKCSECGKIVDSRKISKYPYCNGCEVKMESEETDDYYKGAQEEY